MKKPLQLIVCLLFLAGCGRPDTHKFSRVEPVMGTFVQIKVYDEGMTSKELAFAVNEVLDEAKALEGVLSIFDPSSEVIRVNAEKDMFVSDDLWNVLVSAERAATMTGGEFDITVSPVMKANGFYYDMPEEVLQTIPDNFEGVGWDNVDLFEQEKRVMLLNGAWIDLSGIAKGYIVDRVSKGLKGRGVDHMLVNAGGDMYCGTNGNDYPWKVGIRKPGEPGVSIVLELRNMAVATSGDYENVVTDKNTGEVVSHIIDPATDQPVEEKPSSMTVITSTCTMADALATGMMAMGRDEAIEFANGEEGVAIISIETIDGKEDVHASKGASTYILRRPI